MLFNTMVLKDRIIIVHVLKRQSGVYIALKEVFLPVIIPPVHTGYKNEWNVSYNISDGGQNPVSY